MKIFTDLHHMELFYAQQLLLETRFGHELWRPIGLDWKNEGYWNIDNDPEFAECMLSEIDGKCNEILSEYNNLVGKSWAVFSLHLPRIGKITDVGFGLYSIEDKSKNCLQNAITLEAFKNTKFDIIISSLPQHYHLYEDLRRKYQPQAKHIFHVASINWNLPDGVKNVMLNSKPNSSLGGINYVSYKQEFDLDIFKYSTPVNSQVVRSYVHFPQTEQLWNDLALGWDFKFIGKTLGPLKDIIIDTRQLAQEMAKSAFTLHIKPGAESYGHCLFNSYASGRPVIINKKDYEGTIGEDLLASDTCIDASRHSTSELRSIIQRASEPNEHMLLCERVYDRFKKVVNFDEDAENVRLFLERLL